MDENRGLSPVSEAEFRHQPALVPPTGPVFLFQLSLQTKTLSASFYNFTFVRVWLVDSVLIDASFHNSLQEHITPEPLSVLMNDNSVITPSAIFRIVLPLKGFRVRPRTVVIIRSNESNDIPPF